MVGQHCYKVRTPLPSAIAKRVAFIRYNCAAGLADCDFMPPTPTIDKLAHSGIVLNQFFTFRICGPSRSSFLSGRYPMHVTESNAAIYSKGNEVPLGMTLISEKLKQAGYFTVHIGKWHIGSTTVWHLPANRGFDHSFGFLGGSQNYDRQTRG